MSWDHEGQQNASLPNLSIQNKKKTRQIQSPTEFLSNRNLCFGHELIQHITDTEDICSTMILKIT